MNQAFWFIIQAKHKLPFYNTGIIHAYFIKPTMVAKKIAVNYYNINNCVNSFLTCAQTTVMVDL